MKAKTINHIQELTMKIHIQMIKDRAQVLLRAIETILASVLVDDAPLLVPICVENTTAYIPYQRPHNR